MNDTTKLMVSALMRDKGFQQNEYKIIDITEIYHEVMINRGLLTSVMATEYRPNIKEVYSDYIAATAKNKDGSPSISYEELKDMLVTIQNSVQKTDVYYFSANYLNDVDREINNVAGDHPDGVRKVSINIGTYSNLTLRYAYTGLISHGTGIRHMKDVMNYALALNSKLFIPELFTDTSGQKQILGCIAKTDIAQQILSRIRDAFGSNPGTTDEIDLISNFNVDELAEKYDWSSPFNKCIYVMDQFAFVYTVTNREQASLTLYGMQRGKRPAIPIANWGLGLTTTGQLKSVTEGDLNLANVFQSPGFNELRKLIRRITKTQRMMSVYGESIIKMDNAEFTKEITKISAKVAPVFSSPYAFMLSLYNMTSVSDECDLEKDVYDGIKRAINNGRALVEASGIGDYNSTLETDIIMESEAAIGPLLEALTVGVLMSSCRQIRLHGEPVTLTKNFTRMVNGKTETVNAVECSTLTIGIERPVNKPALGYCDSEDEDSSVTHHMRRGHFKFYTKEKPLFGKVSGLVWFPAMEIGRKTDPMKQSTYKVTSKEVK